MPFVIQGEAEAWEKDGLREKYYMQKELIELLMGIVLLFIVRELKKDRD